MSFIYAVARHDHKVYEQNIKKCVHRNKLYVLDDDTIYDTIGKKYNGLRALVLPKVKDEDIIVFIHEDVQIMSPNFEQRLQQFFNQHKPGIVGVYGSIEWNGWGWWLNDRPKNARGQIVQGYDTGHKIVMRDNGSNCQVAVIDGCMMAISGKLLKELPFREDIPGWHHYDSSYCVEAQKKGYKVYVSDVLIYHRSMGPLNQSYFDGYKYITEIYKDILPYKI